MIVRPIGHVLMGPGSRIEFDGFGFDDDSDIGFMVYGDGVSGTGAGSYDGRESRSLASWSDDGFGDGSATVSLPRRNRCPRR